MKIDPETLANVLQSHFPNGSLTCTLCHGQKIWWDTTVFEFHEYDKVINAKKRLMPVVIATCQNCGQIYFFDAIKMGLIDPKTGELKEKT